MEQTDSGTIYGRNPVIEALKSGREIDKILMSATAGSVNVIYALAKQRGIVLQKVPAAKINEITKTSAHQGVVAFAAAHRYVDVDDILQKAKDKGEPPFIIVLDGIADGRNLGGILRTANGCGAHGVIIPARRSSGLSDVVAKTSAGALEYTPVAKVANVANTIERLKKQNVWFYCASPDAPDVYYDLPYDGGVGLVIGGEGDGVGKLVAQKCDFHVNIPMYGEINSLNAAVSAGILMYEICKKRRLS